MVGMLLPLPAVVWWALAAAFLLDAGWLCWRLGRRWPARGDERTHRLHHVVCHLAMLYLIVLTALRVPAGHAVPGMVGAMPGMAAGPATGMTPMLLLAADLAIVMYFVAVGVWAALRLVPRLTAGPAAVARLGTAYQLAVSAAMLYMLFVTLR